jgi:hypothetical protein
LPAGFGEGLAALRASPLFGAIERAAAAVIGDDVSGFPPVSRYGLVFGAYVAGGTEPAPPVRFVEMAPKPRRRGRRRDAIDPRSLYDARITLDRVVPSRPGSWHDLMNALVWGTFPRAKAALHARQHRAIVARIEPGARTLPPTRTRELDALALLDEGGVLLPLRGRGEGAPPVVFGHAIYESLAAAIPPAVVAAIDLDVEPTLAMPATLASLDAALAAAIEDPSRFLSPEELRRIDLSP